MNFHYLMENDKIYQNTQYLSITIKKHIGKAIKNVFRQSDAFEIFEKHAILADGYNAIKNKELYDKL